MATPYLQLWAEEVASTQDMARSELDHMPVRRGGPTTNCGSWKGRRGLAVGAPSPRGLSGVPPFR